MRNLGFIPTNRACSHCKNEFAWIQYYFRVSVSSGVLEFSVCVCKFLFWLEYHTQTELTD